MIHRARSVRGMVFWGLMLGGIVGDLNMLMPLSRGILRREDF